MKIRISALLLTLCLLVCTLPVSAAESGLLIAPAPTDWLVPSVHDAAPAYTDLAGAWCADAADTVSRAGLLEGYADGTFHPERPLTNAQIVAVSARLCDLLAGGDGQIPLPYDDAPWYQGYYDYLDAKPLYDDGSTVSALYPADEACSRDHFVCLLSAVLNHADVSLPERNAVSCIPDWLLTPGVNEYPLTFYRAGILNGVDAYGTFDGEGILNRGQAAAILARLVDPAQRLTFTLQSFDLCRDALGLAPSTVLLTVDGTPVTAEELAPVLVSSLLQWGKDTTNRALSAAITRYLTETHCYVTLAAAKHVSLTAQQQADCTAFGQCNAGVFGGTAHYWTIWQQRLALSQALHDFYALQPDFDMKPDLFRNADLAQETTRLADVTVQANALTALNLRAVYERAGRFPLRGSF